MFDTGCFVFVVLALRLKLYGYLIAFYLAKRYFEFRVDCE